MKKKWIIVLLICTSLLISCTQSTKGNTLVWYLDLQDLNSQNWVQAKDIAKDGTIQNAYTKKFNEILKQKKIQTNVIFKKLNYPVSSSTQNPIDAAIQEEVKKGNQVDIIPYMHTNIDDMQVLDNAFDGTYSKKFYASMPSTYWKSQKLNDHTYYIPKITLYAKKRAIAFNKSELSKQHIDPQSLSYHLADALPIMRKAKADGILPFGYTDLDYDNYFSGMYIPLPTLSDYVTSLYLKKVDGTYKVVNLFEEDAYKNFLKTIEEMNKEKLTGSELKQNDYDAKMKNGSMMNFSYYYPENLLKNSSRAQNQVLIPSDNYVYIRTGGDAIYKNSKMTKEAVEIISLIDTDTTLSNLFIYGLKDKDYTIENGIVKPLRNNLVLPDSLGSPAVLGNYIIATPSTKSCPNQKQAIMQYLHQLPDEAYVGFYPKKPPHWDAINDIFQSQLATTAYFSDKGLLEHNEQLNKKLKEAGIDEAIQDIQKQLDTYMNGESHGNTN